MEQRLLLELWAAAAAMMSIVIRRLERVCGDCVWTTRGISAGRIVEGMNGGDAEDLADGVERCHSFRHKKKGWDPR